MDITQERKAEIVKELLNSVEGNSIIIYKHETSFNKEEMALVHANLQDLVDLHDTRESTVINVKELLDNARYYDPVLNNNMDQALQEEGTFLTKHSKFLSIGSWAVTPTLITAGLAIPSLVSPALSTNVALAGIATSFIGASTLISVAAQAEHNKSQIELKSVLNDQFDLPNTPENKFEVKNNTESVLEKIRGYVGANKNGNKLSM